MTPHQQETKRRAEVMLAYAEGKEIEVLDKQSKIPFAIANSLETFRWDLYDYRAKPTTRPWTAEDVPPNAWIRLGGLGPWRPLRITRDRLVYIDVNYSAEGVTYGHLSIHGEYSTDLKTWRKCEVAV